MAVSRLISLSDKELMTFLHQKGVKDVITNPFKRETISSLHNLSVSDIFRDKKEAIVPCHMWPVLWITIYLQPD